MEDSSDHRRSHLLQLPGGSRDGVPGLQEGKGGGVLIPLDLVDSRLTVGTMQHPRITMYARRCVCVSTVYPQRSGSAEHSPVREQHCEDL